MSTLSLPTPSSTLRWNMRQLYWDIFWFGMLAGSTMAFMAVYAARLGATSIQIGLLSAGPAVVNLFFTLPAGRWLEGKPLIKTSFFTALIQRSGYVLIIFLPWMFIGVGQVWGMVVITLGMSIAGTVLAIAFNAMFAEVVPPEWRAYSVGRRNALVAVSVTLTTLLCGQILNRLPFPVNYQVVFVIGALGAAMSTYHLRRIRPEFAELDAGIPSQAISPPERKAHWLDWIPIGRRRAAAAPSNGKPLLRLDLLRGPYGLFMVGCLSFYMFQYFSVPIFPVFNVNVLGLTDSMISLGTAMFHSTMMLASIALERVTARLGHRKVMLIGVFAFAQYPLLLGLAADQRLFYAASLIGGIIFAFVNGGLVNRLMERVPADDRPAHMTLHNLALSLGILAGSLLGPMAGDLMGLRGAMLLSSGLRLLAGLLLLLWG